MYYITDTLLKELPEEVRRVIQEKGLSAEEAEAMAAQKESDNDMDGLSEMDVDVTAPDREESERTDDETKLPKAVRYGDEGQYEGTMDGNGRMADLAESKRNAIEDFGEASKRGDALLAMMDSGAKGTEKKSMKKKRRLSNEQIATDEEELQV